MSAYITPTAFLLANVPVRTIPGVEGTDFRSEIESRLDLGRADAFLELLQKADGDVTSAYRHVLSWSEGVIRGKIHVPRFVQGISRKDTRGVPVILARRQMSTPENLLIAEAFRLCMAIAARWKSRGGAEAHYAELLLNGLQTYEGTSPWSELRTKARPSLIELVGVVDGRLRTGEIEVGSLYEKTALLFSRRSGNANAFEKAATWISLLISLAPEFEDRVFELLCLSWIISALQSYCSEVVIRPDSLRGRRDGPVATGRFGNYEVSVFYQQSAGVLPGSLWLDRHTQRPFRALPDIVLKISDGPADRFVILDSKNRSIASESEVAYKLMGYRENLGIEPFQAIAMYPSFSDELRLRRLVKKASTDQILLIHIPISNGRQIVGKIARKFLSALHSENTTKEHSGMD